MRISKTLVAFCAIAVGAALIGNATADTEAQAKAREALRKRLAEEGQSTPASPAPAPAAPVAPAATVAPVQPARPTAPASGQTDKLREALRQKIQELNQQGTSAPVTPAPTVTPAPVAAPPVVTPAPVAAPAPVAPRSPAVTAPAVTPVVRSADEEKLRQALRQKIQELNQQEAVVTPARVAAPAPVVAPAPVAPRSPAVTAPAVTPVVRSADEEKLRQALRQKIQELNQQEAVVTPARVMSPAPVVAPAPVVTPPPVTVTPAPAAVEPSPNKEQLRQAVRQKIQELNQPVAGTTAQTPVAAVRQTPTVSEAQLEQMRQQLRAKIAEERAQEPAATLAVPVQPITTDPAEQSRLTAEAQARRDAELAAARAAVEEQRRAEAAAQAAAALQNPTLRKPATAPGPRIGAPGFAPMVAPPTALSSSKEGRLADLTRRYKADEMTPEEYHKERAKLIAEP